MAAYTFCPLGRGGLIAVQVCELPSDEAALARAFALFEQHPGADQAEIWQGERLLCRAGRRQDLRSSPITDS